MFRKTASRQTSSDYETVYRRLVKVETDLEALKTQLVDTLDQIRRKHARVQTIERRLRDREADQEDCVDCPPPGSQGDLSHLDPYSRKVEMIRRQGNALTRRGAHDTPVSG